MFSYSTVPVCILWIHHDPRIIFLKIICKILFIICSFTISLLVIWFTQKIYKQFPVNCLKTFWLIRISYLYAHIHTLPPPIRTKYSVVGHIQKHFTWSERVCYFLFIKSVINYVLIKIGDKFKLLTTYRYNLLNR